MNGYKTLISIDELRAHLDDADWAIVDSRFMLSEPEKGREKYLAGHIPGAVFADLNLDLSIAHVPGKTGRHPLPSIEQSAKMFSRLGIEAGVQVVAYDDQGGALAAGRTWWMLRWLGHEAVAVLDGGWQAWLEAGYPTRSGEERRPFRQLVPQPRRELIASTEEVERMRKDPASRVFDARAAERYRGQNETIDPVAGHIPGAISAPYMENLTAKGTFRPAEELREHYQRLLAGAAAEATATYCGSGVTSIPNLLAMQHAGLGEGKLYVGSWSEWITEPGRPIATGEE